MEVIIDEIEIESLDCAYGIVFLKSLQNFKKILEQKIAALEVKLGKVTNHEPRDRICSQD